MNHNYKQSYLELKNIQKKTNSIIFDFFDNYHDFFVHKQKLKPDVLIDMNHKIVDEYNNLINWIKNNEFEFKYKDMNQNNIDIIYEDIMNKKIYDLEEYHLHKDFNPFYFTYLLMELYITIPYIMYEYLLQNEITSDVNVEKNKYRLLVKKLTFDLYKNLNVFKEWDLLDNKVLSLVFEENECPEGIQTPYTKIHKEFQDLMNQHYILRNKYEDSYKAITQNDFWKTKWWILLIVAILLIAIVVVAVVISVLKKQKTGA